jgi:glycosyltransferase involved in cell wall biosynthesis
MFVSVILSTYESPDWLTKVIWGYAAQTYQQFELVIADDGSSEGTAQRIEELRRATQLSLHHVWQAKQGFGKCRILNRAIRAAAADYLVFSDGDCIPRADFLEQHVRMASPGRVLSGGMLRLPRDLSERINVDDIFSGRFTSLRWLAHVGGMRTRKLLMLVPHGHIATLFDKLTTTRATFNGHNTSVWKKDMLRVNGFDERLGYGGLDREVGERLVNAGVRPMQIRHRAICVHLDHPRSYVDAAVWANNHRIRAENRHNHSQWTPYGIYQGAELLRVVTDGAPHETAATEARLRRAA